MKPSDTLRRSQTLCKEGYYILICIRLTVKSEFEQIKQSIVVITDL